MRITDHLRLGHGPERLFAQGDPGDAGGPGRAGISDGFHGSSLAPRLGRDVHGHLQPPPDREGFPIPCPSSKAVRTLFPIAAAYLSLMWMLVRRPGFSFFRMPTGFLFGYFAVGADFVPLPLSEPDDGPVLGRRVRRAPARRLGRRGDAGPVGEAPEDPVFEQHHRRDHLLRPDPRRASRRRFRRALLPVLHASPSAWAK